MLFCLHSTLKQRILTNNIDSVVTNAMTLCIPCTISTTLLIICHSISYIIHDCTFLFFHINIGYAWFTFQIDHKDDPFNMLSMYCLESELIHWLPKIKSSYIALYIDLMLLWLKLLANSIIQIP